MKLLILLGVTFLLSCYHTESHKNINSNKKDSLIYNKKDSFNIFLDKFGLKDLPILIDEKILAHFAYDNPDLDTFLVSRFIEKDKIIIGDLTTYSSNKYYPLFKFKVGSGWAVIIMYSSGSGATDDKYHLIIYNRLEQVKSNLIVGKQVGSCESLETQTFWISPDFIVNCKNNYYIGNCETDKMRLSKTQILKYQIDMNGSINQLK